VSTAAVFTAPTAPAAASPRALAVTEITDKENNAEIKQAVLSRFTRVILNTISDANHSMSAVKINSFKTLLIAPHSRRGQCIIAGKIAIIILRFS
jgi:hypothetical protein